METKKEVKQPAVAKPKVVKIDNLRTENTDKLEKYFKDVLKVSDIESRKIMSRLYTKITERLKTKVK